MGGISNPSVLNFSPSQAVFNAAQLQGRAVATTAPTDGQALIWSTLLSQWVPDDVAASGGGGVTSWNDLQDRPDLSVYALASALANYLETSNFTWANLGGKPSLFSGSWNDLSDRPDLSAYVLASALAQTLGDYVLGSDLVQVLANYLQTADFTWANLSGKPDLSVYALASALSNYLLTSNFTWANLGGKPALFSGSWDDLTDKPTIPEPFIWDFETTVPAGSWALNTLITLPHGLGEIAEIVQVRLICAIANQGYSPGDVAEADFTYVNAYYGHGVFHDATNLYIRTASGHIIPSKNAQIFFPLTANQWTIEIKASKLVPPIASPGGGAGGRAWTLLQENITPVLTSTISIPHSLGANIEDARWFLHLNSNAYIHPSGSKIPVSSFASESEIMTYWNDTHAIIVIGDAGFRLLDTATPTWRSITATSHTLSVEVK